MIQGQKHLSHVEVSAFIDGELSASEVQDIEHHLTTCHACALSVVSAGQLKAATVRASERFVAPPDTLSRLAAQLHSETPRKPTRVYPIRPWIWGAVAAALIVAASVFGWREATRSNSLTAELLDQHLAVLSSGATPEVISSDRHTVKPWFQGKLPFSFNLPDPLPAETTLKGGDLTFLHGQPAALLLFAIGKHQVSVFVTQRSSGERAVVLLRTQSGFNLHYADTHDLRIIGVSDVNSAELVRLISVLAEAQSPR
jgi:anti-sigma factor RsiW